MVASETTSTSRPLPVVLDCDTGIDDALALVYLAALHKEGTIALQCVTTTAGNTTVERTAANSRYILALCGVDDVPVIAGEEFPVVEKLVTTPETHGDSGLGYATVPKKYVADTENTSWMDAWEYHIDEQETRLIVTGPATDLALWSREHELPTHVTWMGGAFLYPGNTTPTAEWNSWVDPHAAQEVFQAATRDSRLITVVSLGVTEQFTIDDAELTRLLSHLTENELGIVLHQAMKFYFEFHEEQGVGYKAQIHDLLASMIALKTINYSGQNATVAVESESELLRGTTVADIKGQWDQKDNALVVTQADIDAAHKEFSRALGILFEDSSVR